MTQQKTQNNKTGGELRNANWKSDFSVETVAQACADLSDDEREAVVWLARTAKHPANAWNKDQIAKRIGYSRGTVHNLFRGTLVQDGGNLAKTIGAIKAFRKEYLAAHVDADIIETSLTRRVESAIQFAASMNDIVSISGPPQIGKTEALLMAGRKDPRVMVVRTPAACGKVGFFREVAEQLGISPKNDFVRVRGRLKRFLTSNVVLVVDEVHELVETYSRPALVQILEVLREFNADRKGCGLVLCGTLVWTGKKGEAVDLWSKLAENTDGKWIQQFRRRGVVDVELESVPEPGDLAAVLKHYGLKYPKRDTKEGRLLAGIILEHGLGKLTRYLKAARGLARKRGQRVSWAHVITADATLKSFSRKKGGAR